MKDIKKQIQVTTQIDNLDKALEHLFKDYLKCKLFCLDSENKQYELKWKMDFVEFEKKFATLPDATHYEMEKELFEWEAIYTQTEYYKKLANEWA